MTETEVMEEIKQLSVAYKEHNGSSFFTSQHIEYITLIKHTTLSEIANAQTPQEVMNCLYQEHGFIPYKHLQRHEVLALNRTPWWLWFIKAFFILITFPLSVPFLMIWSWNVRETPNFLRTNGSIYLEKVLELCRQVGVVSPELPTALVSSSFSKNTPSRTSELNKGIPMQEESTHLLQPLEEEEADNTNTFEQAVIFGVLFTQIEDDEQFSNLFCALFGKERTIMSKFCRLQRELSSCQQTGQFPSSLFELISLHFRPKYAEYLREKGETFLDVSVMEQIESSDNAIEEGYSEDVIVKALAHLLQINLHIYSQSALHLSLITSFDYGALTVSVLKEGQNYYPLLDMMQLNQTQKDNFQSLPRLDFFPKPSTLDNPCVFTTNDFIHLEKVFTLSQQKSEHSPRLSHASVSISLSESTHSSPRESRLNEGIIQKKFTNPLKALGGSSRASVFETQQTPLPPVTPSEDVAEMAAVMTKIGNDFMQAMTNRPTIFLETQVSRTKGDIVFLDTPPLEKLAPNKYVQKIVYAALWTKPWQQLDEFHSQITVFREFTVVRPLQKTNTPKIDILQVDILPSTSSVGCMDSICSFFYGDRKKSLDCKTLIAKAQSRGNKSEADAFFYQALAAAKNNQECVDVLEGLINFCHKNIEYFKKELGPRFYRENDEESQSRFQESLKEMTDELDKYLDMLPENYCECSETAQTLRAFFEEIWALFDNPDPKLVADAFDRKEIEIKALIDSAFVKLALPHFLCMWHQLMGFLFLTGRPPILLFCIDDESGNALRHFNYTLKLLQQYNLPEAQAFNKEVVIPLQAMQTHVEQLFNKTPSKTRQQHAREYFRDFRLWELEGRSPSFRIGSRGMPTEIPYWLANEHRRALTNLGEIDTQQSQFQLTMF